MPVTVRPAGERGHGEHGWLDTRHSFSFADYFDPRHMGFRALRVINEDRVQAGTGFPTHGHRDMEIISYIIGGALEHRDSTGGHAVIRRGEVQRMTAGTGVRHSEGNPSRDEAVHFLQIWLLPEREGLTPGYEQKLFAEAEKRNRLCLLAAPGGEAGSLLIHQDVRVYAALLDAGAEVAQPLAPGRGAWVQVVSGALRVNGTPLAAGDGAALDGEAAVRIEAAEAAELLLFDLA